MLKLDEKLLYVEVGICGRKDSCSSPKKVQALIDSGTEIPVISDEFL